MRPAWATYQVQCQPATEAISREGGRQSTIMQRDVQFPLVEDIRKTVMEEEHLPVSWKSVNSGTETFRGSLEQAQG